FVKRALATAASVPRATWHSFVERSNKMTNLRRSFLGAALLSGGILLVNCESGENASSGPSGGSEAKASATGTGTGTGPGRAGPGSGGGSASGPRGAGGTTTGPGPGPGPGSGGSTVGPGPGSGGSTSTGGPITGDGCKDGMCLNKDCKPLGTAAQIDMYP